MPRPHDPFPMTSPEAQRLAAGSSSTTQEDDDQPNDHNSNTNDWKTMTTTAAHRGPRDDEYTERGTTAAERGLLSGGKKKKRPTTDDALLYADADEASDASDNHATDAFFDRPLDDRNATRTERRILRCLDGFQSLYHRLYGDKLPPSEMLRTLCLASTLFFMIGGYWLLRSLKDPILTSICGVSVIPQAKMMSVVVVLGVVSIYNRFLDSDLPKHALFYLFGTFYFVVFFLIGLLLMHPTIGLPNQQASPRRLLGWVSYCAIESFGSVMVSLFWSFCNSNVTLETAKASYGVMVATAQIGSILGPTLVNVYAESLGLARLYLLGACCMLLLQGTMRFYVATYGVQQAAQSSSSTASKPEKPGVLEGLVLFAKYNYVKGIFAISCLFMVEVTIVDFTMKLLAKEYFSQEYPCAEYASCFDVSGHGQHGMSEGATAAFTAFMGFFGQATNTLSFLMSLLGTSAVIRTLGLRLTLLLFPSLCLAVIIFVRLQPTLYVVFGAMMILKASSYALNNPTKEILYQPTSSAVRYKAKSWIDIFGARGSKALGSLVTNAFSDSATHLVANGSLVGMAVASFLIWNAGFMGNKFDEYTSTGYIVGQDDTDTTHELLGSSDDAIELVDTQQVEDTSCAILVDDEQGNTMYQDDTVGREEEGQDPHNTDNNPESRAASEKGKDDEAQVTMV